MLGDQEDSVQFSIEPVVGYRTWRMTEDLDLVGVVYSKAIWPFPADARAECLHYGRATSWAAWHGPEGDLEQLPPKHKPSQVPVKDCNCGFYGYWSYPIVQARSVSMFSTIQTLRGVCLGWGKTWLAEHGWRSKYARPIGFLSWPERRNNVRNPFKQVTEEDRKETDHWNRVAEQIAIRYNVPLVETPSELLDIAESYV
jgi:hypothetical protein